MKPRRFSYERPRELHEALAILRDDSEAKPLAGGQSLLPMLNFRITSPQTIVDLNDLAELRGIRRSGGILRVGAMTRQVALEHSLTAREDWPLLTEALRWVAHPPIRNRGTIGGSVAHADPAAELPLVLSLLGARFACASAAGERVLEWDEFFIGNLQTTLADDELLVRIDVPHPGTDAIFGFYEFARRHGDFALGGAAVVADVHGDQWTNLRVGLLGASGRPVIFAVEAEGHRDELAGLDLAEQVEAVSAPTGDLHGDAQFRRRILRACVARALADAAARWAARPLI